MVIVTREPGRRFADHLRRLISMCLLLPFLLMSGYCSVTAEVKIQGTVLSDQGKPAVNVAVFLMKIVMQKKPSITPFKQSMTDQDGRYEFRVKPLEGNVFFRITAGSGSSMTGSEPFRLNADRTVKMGQLVLPGTLAGINHLSFNKHIIIFEALEEALQITEVINFSNNSDNVVDTSAEPLVKQIPADAANFQFFKRGRSEAIREKDRVVFDLEVAPGDHQLLFSYDLPVSGRVVGFSAYLPPKTKEFEMVAPSNTLNLSFDQSSGLSSTKIVSQEKRFNNKSYYSLTVFPNDSQSEIKIRIGSIPISQTRFFYPAIVLAAILILGLLLFLAKRPQLAPNKGRQ